MKKIAIIVVAFFLVLTLAACGAKDEGKYKDGTYTAESVDEGKGYEDGTVVIKNGKIESITLRRLTSEGEEVDYSVWNGEDKYPNLQDYRIQLADEMVEAQGTEGVDTITGATRSTANWIDIVDECLAQAKK